MSRYDRLLELSSFSEEKLHLLQSKNVLIVGTGGVGQHIAVYLATNGIERLTIVDYDEVELSNLNRQLLSSEKDVGKDKVFVVKAALLQVNSDIKVEALKMKLDSSNIKEIPTNFDVVIDAVDNWETKLLLTRFCNENHIPFLHVGVDGYGGQYCLFKDKSLLDLVSDSVKEEKRDGVLGPMVGLISSMACLHLIRYLAGEDVETDTIFSYDAETNMLLKGKIC